MNVLTAIFLATAAYGLYKRKWTALFFVLAAILCSCEAPPKKELPCYGLESYEVGDHGVTSTICGIDTLKVTK